MVALREQMISGHKSKSQGQMVMTSSASKSPNLIQLLLLDRVWPLFCFDIRAQAKVMIQEQYLNYFFSIFF